MAVAAATALDVRLTARWRLPRSRRYARFTRASSRR